MSLIITSNTQDEYKDFDHRGHGMTGRQMGIEKPADYHNHLSSPLEVGKNSQIAVQSVKFTRHATYDLDGENLLYYFGRELGDTLDLEAVDSRPELIQIRKGTLDREEFAKELERELNFSCNAPAVFNNFEVNVSLIGNDFGGYCISASQRGTGWTDKKTIMTTWIPDVPIDMVGTKHPYPASDQFTVTGQVFARDSPTSPIFDDKCVGILTDCPMATHNGSGGEEGANVVINFTNTSGVLTGGEALPWMIGLTRPTLFTNKDADDMGTMGIAPLDWHVAPDPTMTRLHFYDYVVGFDGDGIKVYQSCYEKDDDGEPIANSFRLREIRYHGGADQSFGSEILKADMYQQGAKYQRLSFEAYGDEIAVWIDADNDSWKQILDSRQGGTAVNASRVYKPVSQWTNALYVKAELTGGSIEIDQYDSYSTTATDYKYPTLTGADANYQNGTYNVGDSPYSNVISRTPQITDAGHEVANQRPCWAFDLSKHLIKNPDRADNQMLPYDINSAVNPYFVGVNADEGVDYQHILILEPTGPPPEATHAIGDYFSNMCHMSALLGWFGVAVLDQALGTVTDSNMVTWCSANIPDFSVHSAFVRLLNTTQRSYNSCKNSISKILYHIPRFTNDGRQWGELFFEVSERTYVDFGNTDKFVLNQFQVQICDKNERVVEDLTGETIVVFHIRQKAEAGKYE